MKRSILILMTMGALALVFTSCTSSAAVTTTSSQAAIPNQSPDTTVEIWRSPDYGPPKPFNRDEAIADGYHAESVPGSLKWVDVYTSLKVCVHLPPAAEPQWNAEVVGLDTNSKMITLREHFHDHDETGTFPAAGYGLEPDPNMGYLWANVWLTPGVC